MITAAAPSVSGVLFAAVTVPCLRSKAGRNFGNQPWLNFYEYCCRFPAVHGTAAHTRSSPQRPVSPLPGFRRQLVRTVRQRVLLFASDTPCFAICSAVSPSAARSNTRPPQAVPVKDREGVNGRRASDAARECALYWHPPAYGPAFTDADRQNG